MQRNKLLNEMDTSLKAYKQLTNSKGGAHSVAGEEPSRRLVLSGSRSESPPPPPPPRTQGKTTNVQIPAHSSVGLVSGGGQSPYHAGPAHTSVDRMTGYGYLTGAGMNTLTPAPIGVGQRQFVPPSYANVLGPAPIGVDQNNFGMRNMSPLLIPAHTSVGQQGQGISTPLALQPGTQLGSDRRSNQPGVNRVLPAPVQFIPTQNIAPALQVPSGTRFPMASQSGVGTGNRADFTNNWVLAHASPPVNEGVAQFKVPEIPPFRAETAQAKAPPEQGPQKQNPSKAKTVFLTSRRARSVVQSAPEARGNRSNASVLTEGRFQPVYEGDQSEVDPDDSVSHHVPPDTPASRASQQQQGGQEEEQAQLVPIKQDFIDMIRRIAMKEKPDPGEESKDSDPMKQYFGDTSGYYKDKPKKKSLPFSDQQRRILDDILHTQEPHKTTAGFEGRRQGVAYIDEDYDAYLRPLELNKEAQVYLKYVTSQPSSTSTTNQKPQPAKSEGLKNQLAKELVKDLEKIDVATKLGLRFAGFGQWLLTSQRIILEEELGAAHPLLQKDSDLSKVLVESFKTYNTLLSQFARISVLDCMSRRKLSMEEISFDKIPKEQALHLPMDSEGKHLFGSSKDADEKVTSFETIAPDYAKKLTAIRDSRAALRNPRSLSLPAGLPREDVERSGGGSGSTENRRKRKPKSKQGSGGGQTQNKRQKQSDTRNQEYKQNQQQNYQRQHNNQSGNNYNQSGNNYSKNQPFRDNYGGGAGKGGGRRR